MAQELNSFPRIRTDIDVPDLGDVDIATFCNEQPWYCDFGTRQPAPEPQPIERKAFASVKEWIASLRVPLIEHVGAEEQKRREAICLKCPHNQSHKKSNVRDVIVLSRRNPHIKLGACSHFNHDNNIAVTMQHLNHAQEPPQDYSACWCQ